MSEFFAMGGYAFRKQNTVQELCLIFDWIIC